jgi:hypothetical protein
VFEDYVLIMYYVLIVFEDYVFEDHVYLNSRVDAHCICLLNSMHL